MMARVSYAPGLGRTKKIYHPILLSHVHYDVSLSGTCPASEVRTSSTAKTTKAKQHARGGTKQCYNMAENESIYSYQGATFHAETTTR